MAQEKYENFIYQIRPEQARAIGSWVLGITYMQRLSELLTLDETAKAALSPVNGSAKKFLATLRDEEFRAVRESFGSIKPDSNAFIARQRMGVAKSIQSSLGNVRVLPNREFIVATHYLEDENYRAKLDSSAPIGTIIAGSESFVDFYLERAADILHGDGQFVTIPEIIHDARRDMEFWLEESS